MIKSIEDVFNTDNCVGCGGGCENIYVKCGEDEFDALEEFEDFNAVGEFTEGEFTEGELDIEEGGDEIEIYSCFGDGLDNDYENDYEDMEEFDELED